MRVLVTGGRGYIGSNLIKYFNDKDVLWESIDSLEGDYLEKITTLDGFDFVVHLAASPGIEFCDQNIDVAIKNNIIATQRLFTIADLEGVPVIFTSSQAAKNPKSSIYALCKRSGEISAQNINSQGQTNIKVLRLANVYGGNLYLQSKSSVVAQFAKSILSEGVPTVHGNGQQVRDFIHVRDVCRAIYKCMIWNPTFTEPVDIGTGIGTTIVELAEMFGFGFTFDPSSDRIGISSNIADTTKAQELFAFKAKIKLEDAIRKEFLNGV